MKRIASIVIMISCSYAVRDLHTLASPEREMSYPFFHGYDLPDGTHWNGVVKEDRWVYDVSEHISNILVILAFRVALAIPLLSALSMLEFCDLVDYILIYSYDWGTIRGVKIDYDKIKLILALFFSLIQLWTIRRYIGSSE